MRLYQYNTHRHKIVVMSTPRTEQQSSQGKAFRQMLTEQGIKPAEIARLAGVKQQTVMHWIKRGVASNSAFLIAAHLHCKPEQISGIKQRVPHEIRQIAAEYAALPPVKVLPIIDWATASNLPAAPIPPKGTAAFTIKPCNERAFALRQQGNSMEPPSGLGHSVWAPAGCLLIADPDAPHTPGCFTIAQPAGYPEPICRKLIVDGGRMVLVALNHQYPNIDVTEGCRLIAPVIDVQLNYTL